MRFYSKVTAVLYLNAFTAVVWIALGFFSRNYSGFYKLLAGLYCFTFFSTFAAQLFTYWELRPDGLYEHRPFRKRTVPFQQIKAVKAESPTGKPATNWLKICYTSPFPSFETDQAAPDRGTLLLAPAHRSELLLALRHAAPQATFETP